MPEHYHMRSLEQRGTFGVIAVLVTMFVAGCATVHSAETPPASQIATAPAPTPTPSWTATARVVDQSEVPPNASRESGTAATLEPSTTPSPTATEVKGGPPPADVPYPNNAARFTIIDLESSSDYEAAIKKLAPDARQRIEDHLQNQLRRQGEISNAATITGTLEIQYILNDARTSWLMIVRNNVQGKYYVPVLRESGIAASLDIYAQNQRDANEEFFELKLVPNPGWSPYKDARQAIAGDQSGWNIVVLRDPNDPSKILAYFNSSVRPDGKWMSPDGEELLKPVDLLAEYSQIPPDVDHVLSAPDHQGEADYCGWVEGSYQGAIAASEKLAPLLIAKIKAGQVEITNLVSKSVGPSALDVLFNLRAHNPVAAYCFDGGSYTDPQSGVELPIGKVLVLSYAVRIRRGDKTINTILNIAIPEHGCLLLKKDGQIGPLEFDNDLQNFLDPNLNYSRISLIYGDGKDDPRLGKVTPTGARLLNPNTNKLFNNQPKNSEPSQLILISKNLDDTALQISKQIYGILLRE